MLFSRRLNDDFARPRHRHSYTSSARPIVLVPGFAGSKLVVARRPSQTQKKRPEPPLQKNEFINLNVLTDARWSETFSPNADGKDVNVDGKVDVYDFGGVDGIRNLCDDCVRLDGLLRCFTKTSLDSVYNYSYFDTLIRRLETRLGYVPRIDLFGAPYDFRTILHDEPSRRLPEFAERLRAVLERSLVTNGRPAVLLAHSIGAVMCYILLAQYFDAGWVRRHVDTFFSVSCPYGGCSTALKVAASGAPFDAPLSWIADRYVDVMRNSSGIALALPNSLAYRPGAAIVRSSATGDSYDVESLSELLSPQMRRAQNLYERDVLPVLQGGTVPPVRMVDVFSSDRSTEVTYDFENNYRHLSAARFAKGDTIVPAESLTAHLVRRRRFAGDYAYHTLPGAAHTNILRDPRFFDVLRGYLMQ